MVKPTRVYTDEAGNVLYKKYIKTRRTWQIYAKNMQGRNVTGQGVTTMVRKARRSGKRVF